MPGYTHSGPQQTTFIIASN